MYNYHLLLYRDGEAEARIQLEAENNSQAAAIGTTVFQSCTDVCDSFEIRRNAVWVAGMAKLGLRRELSVGELREQTQVRVADVEQRLLESQTRISESKRLLSLTQRLLAIHEGHPPERGNPPGHVRKYAARIGV
jgi:hypothetical protein